MNPLDLLTGTRVIVYGVMLLSIGGTLVGYGYHKGVQRLWEYQAEQAVQTVAVVKVIEKVKETVRVNHVKREVVIEKVFVEIERESTNVPLRLACNITAGWMRLHDAAASGDRAADGRVDDAADSGVTEVAAAATVAANYKSFHQVANDLKGCRAFVVGVVEATKQP